MMQRIWMEIGPGSFAEGFPVSLTVEIPGQVRPHKCWGQLPAAADLPRLYQNWQQTYSHWGVQTRRIEVHGDGVMQVSTWQDCLAQAKQLETRLTEWFNAPEFFQLWGYLLKTVQQHQPARLMIQTQEPLLQRLPWHYWKQLLDDFPQLEVAFVPTSGSGKKPLILQNPVRILAILGSSEELNVEMDLAQLMALPHVQVEPLRQPSAQQLQAAIANQRWDIIFFAGHSFSEAGEGYIVLQQSEEGEGANTSKTLRLEELCYTLRDAVAKGLKLAIFNSCDGLGLANALSETHLPAMIVMREPIADSVAQTFLQRFLEMFAQGQPLTLALRKAREMLSENDSQGRRQGQNQNQNQGQEMASYLCADWLPVLFLDPGFSELRWTQRSPWLKQRVLLSATIAAAGLFVAGLGAILWQEAQQRQVAKRVSAGDVVLFQDVSTQVKKEGSQAFLREDYEQAARLFQQSREKYQDDPEALVYENNAKIAKLPAHQRLEIAASLPIGNNPTIAKQMLRGIAQWQQEINRQGGIHQRPIWLWIADDNNNQPDSQKKKWGVAIANYLRQNTHTLAVIGPNSSDAAVAVSNTYNQQQLPMLTPTSFSGELPTSLPYIFRVGPENTFTATKLAEYYLKHFKSSRVVICSDQDSTNSTQFAEAFSVQLNSARVTAKEIQAVNCDLADRNFNPQHIMTQLKAQRVDTVLLAPHVDRLQPAIDFLKAVRATQVQLTLLGSPTLDGEITLEKGREATEGLMLVSPYIPATTDRSAWLQNAHQLWPQRINWRTAFSYDAGMTISGALNQLSPQDSPSRSAIQAMLRRSDFEVPGGTGSIKFSTRSGNRNMGPLVGTVVQVQPVAGSKYGVDFVPIQQGTFK